MAVIFVTGGTGYMGTRLIKELLKRGHIVKALSRAGSQHKLPKGCEVINGNALDGSTYKENISHATVFVHLIGVAHPSPSKKEQFRSIDLVSVQHAADAAISAGVQHFIYVSVAQHPTKLMHDFQQARAEGEELLLQTGMDVSIIRPWYVLGPGHWWPVLLKPLYLLAALVPSARETAAKLSTVSIGQMINTLVYAAEHQPSGAAYYEVEDIQNMVSHA